MFYTYVLYSSAFDKIYIGYSSDVRRRLLSHNDSRNKGWTRNYQPWELIFKEEFPTKTEAIKREHQLKSARGRKFIREEILKRL